jgi:hypothetical protein
MKPRPKIFFNPIEGSAPLSIRWNPGPYGDAHESKEGNGVYFTSPNGELLPAQFDDVEAKQDQQVLTTKSGITINVTVKAARVSIKVNRSTKKVA